jgi:hypothetical protein
MWQPLTEHWHSYQNHLEEAMEDGLFDDPLDAQEILYPDELFMGEGEKDDVRQFITDRLNELYHSYRLEGEEFNPNLIGTYLFRAVLMGMVWERERIGL